MSFDFNGKFLITANGNITCNTTGSMVLPVGTTAQRPASPAAGMLRHNSTLGYAEWYDTATSSWKAVTTPSYTVEYVVIAGGGGGGYGASSSSGGGGGSGGGINTTTDGAVFIMDVGV